MRTPICWIVMRSMTKLMFVFSLRCCTTSCMFCEEKSSVTVLSSALRTVSAGLSASLAGGSSAVTAEAINQDSTTVKHPKRRYRMSGSFFDLASCSPAPFPRMYAERGGAAIGRLSHHQRAFHFTDRETNLRPDRIPVIVVHQQLTSGGSSASRFISFVSQDRLVRNEIRSRIRESSFRGCASNELVNQSKKSFSARLTRDRLATYTDGCPSKQGPPHGYLKTQVVSP